MGVALVNLCWSGGLQADAGWRLHGRSSGRGGLGLDLSLVVGLRIGLGAAVEKRGAHVGVALGWGRGLEGGQAA